MPANCDHQVETQAENGGGSWGGWHLGEPLKKEAPGARVFPAQRVRRGELQGRRARPSRSRPVGWIYEPAAPRRPRWGLGPRGAKPLQSLEQRKAWVLGGGAQNRLEEGQEERAPAQAGAVAAIRAQMLRFAAGAVEVLRSIPVPNRFWRWNSWLSHSATLVFMCRNRTPYV